MLCLGLAATLSVAAQEVILVEAKLLDAPASAKLTKKDCQSAAWLQKKGVKTLSSPRVQTTAGAAATVHVGAIIPLSSPELKALAPNGVHDGLELQILPRSESGQIKFAGSLRVRHLELGVSTKGLAITQFSCREQYFAGECRSGEPVLLSTPSDHNQRRLHLYLVMSQVAGK